MTRSFAPYVLWILLTVIFAGIYLFGTRLGTTDRRVDPPKKPSSE